MMTALITGMSKEPRLRVEGQAAKRSGLPAPVLLLVHLSKRIHSIGLKCLVDFKMYQKY